MTIEFDDKGKYFTDVIAKIAVPAIILTATQRIRGNIHVRQDQRFKEEMDGNEKFLAITDAVVYSMDGHILYRCKFMVIQRAHIIWAIPESEIISPQPEAGGK